MKQSLCLCAMSVALLMPRIHGKEFTNLTFDEPDLSGDMTPLFPGFPNGPFGGSTAQLLRGWSATADGVPITTMAYPSLRK